MNSNNITKLNLGLLIRGLPLGVYIETDVGDVTGAELGKAIRAVSWSAFLSEHFSMEKYILCHSFFLQFI